jgi:uncharacterized protein YukE
MSFEGMDVDQLQTLAKQVNADAQTLSDLVTTLTAVAPRLTAAWHGPLAAAFEQDWQSKLSPSLQAATRTLTDLHTHLANNINAQVSASAADAGPGAGPGTGTGGGTGAILPVVVAGAGAIWTGAQLVGQFTSPVDTVASLIPGASDDLPLLDASGDFDTGTAMVTAGIDGAKAGDALANHQYAAAGGDLVDGTADALKAGGPEDPVPYLAGVTLELGKEDYDLAGQIDWSQGVPNPLTGSNFSTIYAPALEAVPGEMVDPLMKAFF